MPILRILPLLLAGVGLAAGQHPYLVEDHESRPAHPPQSGRLERTKFDGEPDSLAAGLASGAADAALEKLGLSSMKGSPLDDVRWMAVNLDDEPELERVLLVHGGGRSAVLVLKKDAAGWWVLGMFSEDDRWLGGKPLAGIRPTVWGGTNDVVIRYVAGRGSGVLDQQLRIYRVLDSHLYLVLDVVESAYDAKGKTANQFTFPQPEDFYKTPTIVVRQPGKAGALRYVWDREQFRFVAMPKRGNRYGN